MSLVIITTTTTSILISQFFSFSLEIFSIFFELQFSINLCSIGFGDDIFSTFTNQAYYTEGKEIELYFARFKCHINRRLYAHHYSIRKLKILPQLADQFLFLLSYARAVYNIFSIELKTNFVEIYGSD